MKREGKSKKKKEGILYYIFGEMRDSFMFVVISEIILFIPRMILRLIRHLF